jgi:solute carrier family 13 (sodium-dependent dicarboxylate transporter), member 2/3/5
LSTRQLLALAAIIAVAIAACWSIPDPTLARATVIAAAYLVLCLSEVVPPFVPTIVLLVATPLLLGPVSERFELGAVLRWPAESIIALFAGGMALGVAAEKHGVAAWIAALVLRVAGSRARSLVALVMIGTAVLSMWMSNIAAAAMMIAALRPLTQGPTVSASLRRGALLAIAVGANLGGIATPIGTGANGIAIAAVDSQHAISFLHWMAFAVPLVAAMLVVAFVLVVVRTRVAGELAALASAPASLGRAGQAVVVLFCIAVAAWLSEPLHGVSAPLVALAVTAVLFGSGLLERDELGLLDWSTLGLIAGGLCLGRLIEEAGLLSIVADVPWHDYPHVARLGGLVLASALMSAVMSNTATVALLVPLGLAVDPSPSTAIAIAIGASFGMPFTISTPPNAMVYGTGDVPSRDLLWIGVPLMITGCMVVTLTGPLVLHVFGLP